MTYDTSDRMRWQKSNKQLSIAHLTPGKAVAASSQGHTITLCLCVCVCTRSCSPYLCVLVRPCVLITSVSVSGWVLILRSARDRSVSDRAHVRSCVSSRARRHASCGVSSRGRVCACGVRFLVHSRQAGREGVLVCVCVFRLEFRFGAIGFLGCLFF